LFNAAYLKVEERVLGKYNYDFQKTYVSPHGVPTLQAALTDDEGEWRQKLIHWATRRPPLGSDVGFLLEVIGYQADPSWGRARDIWDKYLKPGAPQQVQLPNKTWLDLEEIFKKVHRSWQ
jgi:hypothetical protein